MDVHATHLTGRFIYFILLIFAYLYSYKIMPIKTIVPTTHWQFYFHPSFPFSVFLERWRTDLIFTCVGIHQDSVGDPKSIVSDPTLHRLPDPDLFSNSTQPFSEKAFLTHYYYLIILKNKSSIWKSFCVGQIWTQPTNSGSGSCKIVWIRLDTDPQHYIGDNK